MSDLDNFKAWYVDVLSGLYPNRNAGIAVFMISLPLLERYLRQKTGQGRAQSLTDAFMSELVRLLPSLKDVATARLFWNAYRHGYLHQAAAETVKASGVPLPESWLTHDASEVVQLRPDGSFLLHPVLFSQLVIREIEANFSTFTGAANAPSLPSVQRLDPVTIPSSYIGTK